jgi:septal ring factor EnvC (AmiA/AmiB activator)
MLVFCAAAGAKPHETAKQTVTVPAKNKTHHAATKSAAKPTPQQHPVVAKAPPPPPPPPMAPLDMSHAVPVNQVGALPSTKDRYKQLQGEIQKNKPVVQTARQKSDALRAEAETLRKKLIDTAARVQDLEAEKGSLDAAIAELVIEERQMQANFERDRVQVAKLLAVLERLQHDMPPVIVLKADDALGATHGAMLLGASLPRIYNAAAALSRRLEALRHTRAELQQRRIDSARNAVQLSAARVQLDQLLAIKEHEARTAESVYSDLQAQLDTIADEAADLGSLLAKVASLRASAPANQTVTIVGPSDSKPADLQRGSLRRPVVGRLVAQTATGTAGNMAPGVTFGTQPGATVVAPADGRVLFAGRYHKTGQVLILETPGGYDLVLAGLDRIAARAGDQLLAGEPLGTMPQTGDDERLYFEVRRDGKGLSPLPWLEADLRKAKRS